MVKDIWILVYLENGLYEGVEKVFDTVDEAVRYARASGFSMNSNKSSDFGDFDYISNVNPDNRIVIERETVFIK